MEEVKEEVRGSPKPGLSVTQKKEFSKKTRAEIVEELPTLPANTAQDVINLRRKDFAQNPADLIALLNAAEKSPALKAAIAETKLIENLHLDPKSAAKAFGLLRSNKDEHLRELRNKAVHVARTLANKESSDNPDNHERDSPEQLTHYLIDHPESAFHFLQNPKFQSALTKNPILLANMIVNGDNNLQQTLKKLELTHSTDLPKPVRTALNTLMETVNILKSRQMEGDNAKKRGELRTTAKSIVESPELNEPVIQNINDLNKDTKKVISDAIAAIVNNPALPDTETKRALQARLATLLHAQRTPGEGPSGLSLYNETQALQTHHQAWQNVQRWLSPEKEPVLHQSQQFNEEILPELRNLTAESPLEKLSQYEGVISGEIVPKNSALNDLDKALSELEKIDHDTAEPLHLLRTDLNENTAIIQTHALTTAVNEAKKCVGPMQVIKEKLAVLQKNQHPQYEALKQNWNELNEYMHNLGKTMKVNPKTGQYTLQVPSLQISQLQAAVNACYKEALAHTSASENRTQSSLTQTSLPAKKWGDVVQQEKQQTAAPTAVAPKTVTVPKSQAKNLGQKPKAAAPKSPGMGH